MSIDKLNSAASLIALLREGSGGKIGRAQSKAPSTVSEDVRILNRGDIKELRENLSTLTKDISLEDKSAVEAIRPQVIRSILLWKFGAQLREHSEWQPMLEAINRALGKHHESQENFLKLLQDLKR